jgi:formate dehydrogenase subunit gamma
MSPPELPRFGAASRRAHRATAVLVGVCLLTAAVLYLEPLAVLVGRRALVVRVHVLAGLALPLPALAGWLSAAYRADLRQLNRFTPADTEWLRRRDRRTAGLPVGKFNAGQKLNAALSAGGILVLLGTGIVLEWGRRWPLPLRIGSTFVHDWTAAALTVLLLGHLWHASRDEDARRGMRTGAVPVDWARREHPAWAARLLAAGSGHPDGMQPEQEPDTASDGLPSERSDTASDGLPSERSDTASDGLPREQPDRERVRSRSELLAEERAAGSEDPVGQAAAVLADSDERTEVPDAAPDTVLERRTSAESAD